MTRTVELCETITPRGRRYYLDGKRVGSDHAAFIRQLSKRRDCLCTRTRRNVTRNYVTLTVDR